MSPRAPEPCPPNGEKSFLGPQGWGKVDVIREEHTEHTLTFGSPSMSPDPGRKEGRKENLDSVSCLFFRG